jgi:flagella synthesis protein FlgN
MRSVAQLVERLSAFKDLLEAEANAIQVRDLDALETLIRQKQQLAEELDGLDAALGLTAPQAGSPPPPPLSEEESARLRAMLAACQQQNQLNGAMLDAGMKVNRSLLDIFTGRQRSELTYGRAGRMAEHGHSAQLTQV